MSFETNDCKQSVVLQTKKMYAQPVLTTFGDVRSLTLSGAASGKENTGVGGAVRKN